MQHREPFTLGVSLVSLVACVLVVAGVTGHVGAQATEQPPVVVVQGDSDFDRGLHALQEGRNADAAAAFEAGYKETGNPTALMNLGIAYTNLGRAHDAVRALSAYVVHADASRDAQAIAAVQAEIARLRAENGFVQLQLRPAHATLQVDGETVTAEAGAILVSPGKHLFTVFAEGYQRYTQTLDVPAGRFALDVTLEAPQPVAPVEVVAARPETKTPALREPTDEPEASAAAGCALSSVCVGPVIALLGPPNLIGGGLHFRFGRYLGAGVDYQVLPTININPVAIGASLFSANARVYPFGGAFFLGGGLGYQIVRGQFSDGTLAVGARAGFPAATLNLGFMGHDGFVLGADLGVLFPLGSSHVSVRDMSGDLAQRGIPQAMIDAAKQQAQDRVTQMLDVLPVLLQVNLLRVGYLF